MIGMFLPGCMGAQLFDPDLRFLSFSAALNKDSFSCPRAVGDDGGAGQDGGFEQYGSSKCLDC